MARPAARARAPGGGGLSARGQRRCAGAGAGFAPPNTRVEPYSRRPRFRPSFACTACDVRKKRAVGSAEMRGLACRHARAVSRGVRPELPVPGAAPALGVLTRLRCRAEACMREQVYRADRRARRGGGRRRRASDSATAAPVQEQRGARWATLARGQERRLPSSRASQEAHTSSRCYRSLDTPHSASAGAATDCPGFAGARLGSAEQR